MHSPHLYHHVSVLPEESISILNLKPGMVVVDCTLGGGGHTRRILEAVGPTGRLIAFDRDKVAIDNARSRFESDLSSGRLVLIHAPFSALKFHLSQLDLFGHVNAVFADIGVSSHHLDERERGFSFALDGPLDMRMDQSQGESAADFLNHATAEEISKVLWQFGEEPKARIIARLICKARESKPFTTTGELADLIAKNIFWKEKSKKHPATRTFQAIRIYVNDELGELSQLLDDGFSALAENGVLAIIAFHSLEDRMVKEKMSTYCGKLKNKIPRDIPLSQAEVERLSHIQARVIKPFPIEASADEIKSNPRARSAKLRGIVKTHS